jgi:hypothetical protein
VSIVVIVLSQCGAGFLLAVDYVVSCRKLAWRGIGLTLFRGLASEALHESGLLSSIFPQGDANFLSAVTASGNAVHHNAFAVFYGVTNK